MIVGKDVHQLGTYVMSDIHGCYQEFLTMLDKIGFSDTDQLVIAGDCIDRGSQSYEMLKWMEERPANIRLIRGNHEEEFTAYVDLMLLFDKQINLKTESSSNGDTRILYQTVKYYLKKNALAASYFDLYGTIGILLVHSHVTLDDLCHWSGIIRSLPYYQKLNIEGKTCIAVHAGYAGKLEDIRAKFSRLEEFYLYAREESCQLGGIPHGMIISGHTPTIVKGRFSYNKGNVFRYYDKEKDCIFYDIDCGCVFRSWEADAKLACIRLEDEKIFYV